MYNGETQMWKNDMNRVVAVTNRRLSRHPYLDQIERICRLKPAAVMVREKELKEDEYRNLAEQVLGICSKYRVPCIYHSHPEAALQAGVRSVHLPLPMLRKYRMEGRLAGFLHIGTSVHSEREAEDALRLGATCLVAGHIYATDCKKGVPPRGTDFLRSICARSSVPVWAIGGIHLEEQQMKEVFSCGAAGACCMSDMMRL